MGRKILVIMVIIAATLCLTGIGQAAEQSAMKPIEIPDTTGMKVGKIGFMPFQFNNWFWSQVGEKVHEVIEAHGGTVLDIDPMGDPVKQAEGMDRLLAAGVEGVLITAIDAQALVPSVEAFNKAGIPIVVLMDAPAAGEFVCVITPDHILQGYMSGMVLVNEVKEGKIILIEFPPSRGCRARIEGFLKAIAPYPDLKIVGVDIASGNPEGNTAKTAAMINRYPDVKAAIVAWDDIGLAMIPALKDAGLDQGQVGIYSIDGSAQAIRAMKEGKAFRATSCLYPEGMGEIGAKIMISYLNGNEPPAKYIAQGTGTLTWDDVQAGKGVKDVLSKDQPTFWEIDGEVLPTGDYEWVKER